MPFQKGHKLNIGNKYRKGKPSWNKGIVGYINSGSFKIGHNNTQRENNPNWKGGKTIDDRGYVRINIASNKWKYEHILVMEKHIGRKLKKGECVHHINGVKNDNKLSNLMLFPTISSHTLFHHTYKQ